MFGYTLIKKKTLLQLEEDASQSNRVKKENSILRSELLKREQAWCKVSAILNWTKTKLDTPKVTKAYIKATIEEKEK